MYFYKNLIEERRKLLEQEKIAREAFKDPKENIDMIEKTFYGVIRSIEAQIDGYSEFDEVKRECVNTLWDSLSD